MTNLYRVFHSGVKGMRKLYAADDNYIDTALNLIQKNPEADYYESIYVYNDKHLKQLEETKSLAGILDVKTDRVVFDFDSKNDIELAQREASELINRLILVVPENAIRVFNSGSKGYHVEVHLNEYITREQFEAIVDHYAGDFHSFDQRIKDQQRLFRFPLTRHQTSKRFKIPLSVEQIKTLSTEQIQKLSMRNDKDEFYDLLSSYITVDLPADFKEAMVVKPKEEVQVSKSEVNDRPNLINKPKHLTSAKFALQEGFFEEGERNEACMILASTYRYLGYGETHTYAIIKETLRLRNTRLGLPDLTEQKKEELYATVITPVYSPTWKGGIYSEKENALLLKTIERYKLKDEYQEKSIVYIDEVSKRFLNFAANIDQNTIKTGIAELDQNVLITTGMMVGYLGAPSSGKTSDVITFLEHQSKNNIGAFFVSADMPDNLLFARLLQRYCGYDLKKVLDIIKISPNPVHWDKNMQQAWEQVRVNFRNVGFSFQSGPTVEDINARIKEHEQLTGLKVKVAAIDYLEKIRCHISDSTAATGYNAARLADMTRDNDMASILLLQPQKSAGDPSDALLSMRKVKGASVIEQDCRVIMTKWRPGFNPDSDGINPDDKFSSIAIVKNNMGPTLRLNFHWDGIRGTMRSLSLDEQEEFKRVEKEAYERKNPPSGYGNGNGNSDSGGLY